MTLPVRRGRVILGLLLAVVVLALVGAGVSARTPLHRVRHATRSTPKDAPLNLRPIVGIFTLAFDDTPGQTQSVIPASYVKWLEQAGTRVAVIPFNAPHAELDRLFAGINGLLFTGGGLNLQPDSFYYTQAQYIFNLAVEANKRGDVFPLWGTCQGFQLLNLLASSQPANFSSILKCGIYDSENLSLPLNFTDAAPSSKMFDAAQSIPALWNGLQTTAHPTIYEALATQPITMNLHECGVSPSDFAADPILPAFYNVLSTNVDRQGRPFISTIEAFQFPFWATQWHPERPQFEWDIEEQLVHTAESVAVHAYLPQRWLMLVRQSEHQFPTVDAERAALIYNYAPTFDGTPPYPDRQKYVFQFVYNTTAEKQFSQMPQSAMPAQHQRRRASRRPATPAVSLFENA